MNKTLLKHKDVAELRTVLQEQLPHVPLLDNGWDVCLSSEKVVSKAIDWLADCRNSDAEIVEVAKLVARIKARQKLYVWLMENGPPHHLVHAVSEDEAALDRVLSNPLELVISL